MTTITTKVVLLGDQGVGKTSIRRKFMGLSFKTDHTMTLGVDMSIKTMSINDEHEVEFQVWDFAGQPAFKGLHTRSLLGSQGLMFVFDVVNPTSLENLEYWLNLVESTLKLSKSVRICFVGNKIDLLEQADEGVFQKRINEMVENVVGVETNDVTFILTSAKTGENIEETFREVGLSIVQSMSA